MNYIHPCADRSGADEERQGWKRRVFIVAEEDDEEIVGGMNRQRELVAIASYSDIGRDEAEQSVVEEDCKPVLALRYFAIGQMEKREDEGGDQRLDRLALDLLHQFQRDDPKEDLLAGGLDRSDDEGCGDETQPLQERDAKRVVVLRIAERTDDGKERSNRQIRSRRQEGKAPRPRVCFSNKTDERFFQNSQVGENQSEGKGQEGDVCGKIRRDVGMHQGCRIDSHAKKEQKTGDEGEKQVAVFLFHCFVNVRYTAGDVYSW